MVIIRPSLDCPPKAIRFGVSSALEANLTSLVKPSARRWEIELFFEDPQVGLGLAPYQRMTTAAILRFWTLLRAAYVFLDEQRSQLSCQQARQVTIGETRRFIQRSPACRLIDWIFLQCAQGRPPDARYAALAA